MSNLQVNNGFSNKVIVDKPKPQKRSRYHRNSQNPPSIRLQKRDLEILETIADYRYLTAGQVMALFFKSIHKARRRLFNLWQNKFLERVFLPPRIGEGSPYAIYALGSKGIRLLVTHSGIDREAIGQTIPKARGSYLFIEHTLRRNDFRICLTLACRQEAGMELLFWKQDKSIKSEIDFINGNTGQFRKIPLFPDGFFGIRQKSREYYYFLEIDRGTVNSKQILLRFKAYYNLWSQRLCIKSYGIPNFRVLTVTTSKARMENLIKTARRALDGDLCSNLFMFTTFVKYSINSPENIFNGIWRKINTKDNKLNSLID